MTDQNSFIRPDELWRELGLRAEQTVVHLGAGAGFYLIPAAHIVGKRGHAIGIDVLPNMLAAIENKARQQNIDVAVKTIRANLENEGGSQLPDNTADWVLVANILHQSDPAKVLREATRVCAANGRVVIIEWDTNASPFGPPINQRLSLDLAKQAAGAAGLKIAKEFKPSPYHYGLVLTKN